MQPAEAQKIRALEIPGVYLMREYRRYYPAGEVAGHIIGFTSVDDEGQEGLELAFDHWLAGEDGAKRVIQDRYGKIVQNVEEIRAMRPGPQPRVVDRPAHPVPRVSRVESRDPRPARQVGLGDRARRRHRRSAGDGEPARLQPERPRPDQGQDLSQSRGHRHRRAGLVDQAVRGRGRARLRTGSTTTASSTPTRATSRSAPNYSRIRTTWARSTSRPSSPRAPTSA